MRRALVTFVEDHPHLIANSSWLYESWKHVGCQKTDLVFIGTEAALSKLPEDVVKIGQRPAADDPEWLNYRYVNSVSCLNGEGAALLNDYDRLLRTDVDVFITPAWKQFEPAGFTTGTGHYSNDEKVRDNIRRIARKFGLEHRGITNIGSTIYGEPQLVRDVCGLAAEVCKYIRTVEFKDDMGTWPSWYGGVSLLYATEIAVNHLVPSFTAPLIDLDFSSASTGRVDNYPHIHCYHTKDMFSKFECYEGRYDDMREEELDLSVIRDYCLAMALRARDRAQA